jgi:hypothetical protein
LEFWAEGVSSVETPGNAGLSEDFLQAWLGPQKGARAMGEEVQELLQSFLLRLEPFAKSRLILWVGDLFDPLTDHAPLARLT